MPIFGDHPYTSITVKIDQLAKPHQNDEIDNTLELYVSDLLHLIKIQPGSGASEAARAIRKRIKYGDSVEEQLRALNILELVILNSGKKIGPVIARDDKLLDVLKGVINGSGKTGVGLSYDDEVQKRARQLAIGWKSELEGMDEYKYMASLWKFIPRRRNTKSRRARDNENYDEREEIDAFSDRDGVRSPSPSSPAMRRNDGEVGSSNHRRRPPPRPRSPPPKLSGSSSKSHVDRSGQKKKKKKKKKGIIYADEQYKIPQINYKVEAPNIRNVIADAQTHTTTLKNLLTTLGGVSPLDDDKVQKEFEKCKSIRRKVLKYLQFVGAGDPEEKTPEILAMDDEFLGSLIAANEQLVETFKRYDFLAGYTVDNPAPNYDDEESSEESYYTELDEDYEQDDDLVQLQQQVDEVTETLKASSIKSPPPRPIKPPSLSAPKPKALQKTDTNASASSDPFGDGNEFNGDSRYL